MPTTNGNPTGYVLVQKQIITKHTAFQLIYFKYLFNKINI